MKYTYEISGSAVDGQTWQVSGELETENPGQFMMLPERAMRDSFMKLTHGQAVFGKPGVGCRGPYRVTRMLIAVVTRQ